MPLPPFIASGDLPPGIHRATLSGVLERFGSGRPSVCWWTCDLNASTMWCGQQVILPAVWSSGHLSPPS